MLDQSPALVRAKNRRLVEFLLPGPLTLIRYLLCVPVWPMIVVYAGALPFWPQERVTSHLAGSSDAALWVGPLDWLRVQAPRFNFLGGTVGTVFESRISLSVVMWLIAPHLLWTLVSTLRTLMLGAAHSYAAYFKGEGITAGRRRGRSWGFYFTLQDALTLSDWAADEDYVFYGWSARIQGALGLGLTRVVSTVLWAPLLSIVTVMSVTIYSGFYAGQRHGVCMEQELAFLYAHVSWWAIVCLGHHARHRNLFQPSRSRVQPLVLAGPEKDEATAEYPPKDIETLERDSPADVEEIGREYSTHVKAAAPRSSATETEYSARVEATAPCSSAYAEAMESEYPADNETTAPYSSSYVETTTMYSSGHVGQAAMYSSAEVGATAPNPFSGVEPTASYCSTHVELTTAYVPQTLNRLHPTPL